jgi:hypothetical protein
MELVSIITCLSLNNNNLGESVRRADHKNNESEIAVFVKVFLPSLFLFQALCGEQFGYRILRQINPNYHPTIEQSGSECLLPIPFSGQSEIHDALFGPQAAYGLFCITFGGLAIGFVLLINYKLTSDPVLQDRMIDDVIGVVEKINDLLNQVILSDNCNLKKSLIFSIFTLVANAIFYFVGDAFLNSFTPNMLRVDTLDAIINLSAGTIASTVGFEMVPRGVLYFSKSAYNMSRRVCEKQQQVLPADDITHRPPTFSI